MPVRTGHPTTVNARVRLCDGASPPPWPAQSRSFVDPERHPPSTIPATTDAACQRVGVKSRRSPCSWLWLVAAQDVASTVAKPCTACFWGETRLPVLRTANRVWGSALTRAGARGQVRLQGQGCVGPGSVAALAKEGPRMLRYRGRHETDAGAPSTLVRSWTFQAHVCSVRQRFTRSLTFTAHRRSSAKLKRHCVPRSTVLVAQERWFLYSIAGLPTFWAQSTRS